MKNLLVRTILPLIGVFTLAICASAQATKCTLRVADVKPAPELLGFRLGMTADDVLAREPNIEMARKDKLGFSETSFSPDFNPKIDKAKYPNVRTVSFQFLDGKLYSFWIGYTDAFKWNTADAFLPQISQAVGLTPDGWQKKGLGMTETCDGLSAQFQMIARGPSIRLTDTTVKAEYDKRRAAAEAAKPDEPEQPEE